MLIILKQGPAKGVALDELKKATFADDLNNGIKPLKSAQILNNVFKATLLRTQTLAAGVGWINMERRRCLLF